MSDELKRFLKGRRGDSRRLKVFVEIDAAEPDEACLERLRGLGLEVEQLIANKILGSLEASCLEGVKGDPDVRAVEVSRRLERHDD